MLRRMDFGKTKEIRSGAVVSVTPVPGRSLAKSSEVWHARGYDPRARDVADELPNVRDARGDATASWDVAHKFAKIREISRVGYVGGDNSRAGDVGDDVAKTGPAVAGASARFPVLHQDRQNAVVTWLR